MRHAAWNTSTKRGLQGQDMPICKKLRRSESSGRGSFFNGSHPIAAFMESSEFMEAWKAFIATFKLAKEVSMLHPPCLPMPLRKDKATFQRPISTEKGISTLKELAVSKSWSRLLDGQRRAQVSVIPRIGSVACFRDITRHDYLQVHVFQIGLADSPSRPLCKSVPMTREHLSDFPALLHVLSQDNCGVLPPASATTDLYWTERRRMFKRALAGAVDWCFTIADLVHSPKLVALFSAAPYRRIPIAAGNFDAHFPPQREAPEL
ncbi:hypothetical protein TNCV_3025881 [Trichonephila clavipes]|nr:hypothetical protein TNCV_3025881 [Trichonephila clavipes]